MTIYADSLSLREARSAYFATNGFAPDGGYSARWVRFKVGRIPLAFPNFDARRRAVRFHDLNHVATEYGTDLIGEGQIGAFEVGAGCGRCWTAWGFNLQALSWSAVLAPGRSLRAFARGRRSKSLYRRTLDDAILDATVGRLRSEMELADEPVSTTLREGLTFAGWVLFAWICAALVAAVLIAPLAAILWFAL